MSMTNGFGYMPNQSIPMMDNRNNMFPNQRNSTFLKGWPVASIDEARVATVEMDGTICYMPDLANGRIYTKQLNPADGTATFRMYEEKPVPEPLSEKDYVTRQEFSTTLSEIKGLLQQLIAPPSTQPAPVPMPAPAPAPKEAIKDEISFV